MVVEILFPESCNLYGDGLNVAYLQQTLPEAEFIYTAITDEPYFASKSAMNSLMSFSPFLSSAGKKISASSINFKLAIWL